MDADKSTLTFAAPPTIETELRDYPYVSIRFRCYFCGRRADVRSVACAAKYGHRVTMGRLLLLFRKGCRWSDERIRKPQKYGMRCAGYCYDLYREQPADIPPFRDQAKPFTSEP
ncbi:hypothetical protein GCM10019059_07900 [Camelimonas fluminis]|uniref:Uncharacterized protein n=1 Tax=Camelimonas fluminis TaxID=1576911 RepID=A0ABV7UF21_9HYPH|nr:hypothetical protein [Camelimonas fluminis]GHE51105.1 hypothetical protein GCM10019059_07900 [Camelimonas fluminis]